MCEVKATTVIFGCQSVGTVSIEQGSDTALGAVCSEHPDLGESHMSCVVPVDTEFPFMYHELYFEIEFTCTGPNAVSVMAEAYMDAKQIECLAFDPTNPSFSNVDIETWQWRYESSFYGSRYALLTGPDTDHEDDDWRCKAGSIGIECFLDDGTSEYEYNGGCGASFNCPEGDNGPCSNGYIRVGDFPAVHMVSDHGAISIERHYTADFSAYFWRWYCLSKAPAMHFGCLGGGEIALVSVREDEAGEATICQQHAYLGPSYLSCVPQSYNFQAYSVSYEFTCSGLEKDGLEATAFVESETLECPVFDETDPVYSDDVEWFKGNYFRAFTGTRTVSLSGSTISISPGTGQTFCTSGEWNYDYSGESCGDGKECEGGDGGPCADGSRRYLDLPAAGMSSFTSTQQPSLPPSPELSEISSVSTPPSPGPTVSPTLQPTVSTSSTIARTPTTVLFFAGLLYLLCID